MNASISQKKKSLNIKIGTIITILTFLANVLVYLFFTPFLLKCVGDRQYGIYSLALSITTWFSFASSSISIGYVRFYAKEKTTNPDDNAKHLNGVYLIVFAIYAAIILIVATIMTILMSLGVIHFDKYSDSEQKLITIIFAITILGMIPIILFATFSHFIYANHRFIWFRVGTLLNLVLRTFISIPFLLKGYSIVSVVTIHSITNLVLAVGDVLFALFVLKFKATYKELKKYKFLFKDIIFFTFALLINEVADKLNSTIDPFVLGVFGYAESTTHYMLGCRIAEYASQAVLTIAKNFSPTINENVFNGKDDENNKIFIKLSKTQLTLMALFIGGFAVCGQEFVKLWLGNDYLDVYYICLTLMILYTYMATTITSQDIERAKNKHLWRSLIILITCFVNAVITYLLVMLLPPNSKIYGCILGTTISIVLGYWIALSIYHKKAAGIPIIKYWKEVIVTLLITIPIIIIVLKLDILFPIINSRNIIAFLVKGTLFAAIFSFAVWFFNKDAIPSSVLSFLKRKSK